MLLIEYISILYAQIRTHLTDISATSGWYILLWNIFGISCKNIGTVSARPSATALRTFPPIKKDTDRNTPSNDGSVYSAPPSVCIEHVRTFFSPAVLPCSAIAFTRAVGVAAAPWMNTVSPVKKVRCMILVFYGMV